MHSVYITRLPGLVPITDDSPAAVLAPNCGHTECDEGFHAFLNMLVYVDAVATVREDEHDPTDESLLWGKLVAMVLPAIFDAKERGEDLLELEQQCEQFVNHVQQAQRQPGVAGVAVLPVSFSLN